MSGEVSNTGKVLKTDTSYIQTNKKEIQKEKPIPGAIEKLKKEKSKVSLKKGKNATPKEEKEKIIRQVKEIYKSRYDIVSIKEKYPYLPKNDIEIVKVATQTLEKQAKTKPDYDDIKE